MEIKRAGTQPSGKGPAEWFTGTVRMDPLFQKSRTGEGRWRQRHLRTGSPHGLAHASARADLDRDGWLRLGTARRRTRRRDPPW